MEKRFVSIWFPSLPVDRLSRLQPELKDAAWVLSVSERSKLGVAAASRKAKGKGVSVGMSIADCRAILPGLMVLPHDPVPVAALLSGMAEWCLRYTPVVAIDGLDGLVLEATGCTHLWKGEQNYLDAIFSRLHRGGFEVRLAMAGTIGAAWALARFGPNRSVASSGTEQQVLAPLPPAALRLETVTVERLQKLGLERIGQFLDIPAPALRRRFGSGLNERIAQALGKVVEPLIPIRPIPPFLERLPSLEPIRTAKGIQLALEQLLEWLCKRMEQENKGLRKAILRCYRIDGNIQQVEIGTNRPSRHAAHLFKLFEFKLPSIAPALGIELFHLEAPTVEDLSAEQEALWEVAARADQVQIAVLLDKIAGKIGTAAISRYLPAEHYWPERSFQKADSLEAQPVTGWRTNRRPLRLLRKPSPVEVSVPIPDYPPMLFIHKGQLHKIVRADGPERIEQEWWLQQGEHRDYYIVEDEQGARFWLFRLGHYADGGNPEWFLHGYFG